MDILDVARRNQQKAWEIIEKVNVIPIWESIGAQVNLVGSLAASVSVLVFLMPLSIQILLQYVPVPAPLS